MDNIKFDDYLNEQLKDKEIRKGFIIETTKLEIAVTVSEARQEAGLSQNELAKASDVPQSTIAQIEKGTNTNTDTLAKIAGALGKKVTISFS